MASWLHDLRSSSGSGSNSTIEAAENASWRHVTSAFRSNLPLIVATAAFEVTMLRWTPDYASWLPPLVSVLAVASVVLLVTSSLPDGARGAADSMNAMPSPSGGPFGARGLSSAVAQVGKLVEPAEYSGNSGGGQLYDLKGTADALRATSGGQR